MEYLLHILILIGIYVVLTVSMDLIAGHTGLVSIAHAAFFGVGAYVAALMGLKFGSPFLGSLGVAIIVCGLLGVLVGLPSLRIRDDYFLIATFAFQILAFSVMNNWVSLTGGPMGLPGIPQPRILGWEVSGNWGFLILTAILAMAAVLIARKIIMSPLGRVLRSIREDEILARALGKNVAHFKVLIVVVGAGMAGAAGVVYAHYITFVDPTSFTVMESILILSMVIIGGAGSLWGPAVGAAMLVTVPELLRFIGLNSSVAANVQQMLYGAGLVACMIWRPQGIIGEYAFQKSNAKP